MAKVQVIKKGESNLHVEQEIDTCSVNVLGIPYTDDVVIVINGKKKETEMRLWLNKSEAERIFPPSESE